MSLRKKSFGLQVERLEERETPSHGGSTAVAIAIAVAISSSSSSSHHHHGECGGNQGSCAPKNCHSSGGW